MMSRGILESMTTVVFAEVGRFSSEGRFAFEVFEPIEVQVVGWVEGAVFHVWRALSNDWCYCGSR